MSKQKPIILLALVLSASCSDSQPGVVASGGAGSGGTATAPTAGGAGAPITTAGAAGAPAAAGSATVGGGGAGGATSGGSGGTVAGAPVGIGGVGGSGGSAGVGGAAGAGGGAGLAAIATDFDKFRLECPCIDADHFGSDKTDNCDATPAVDRQTYTKAVAGDANVVYDVKLHVRGNTEPNTYVKGALDANKRFYVGGETSTPGYTAYMLTVTDPPQVYFFNYNPSTSHIHFLIDYEVTIPMRGGTMVKFEVNGGKSVPDGHGVSNREQLVVPDVPPAPKPFNGQFLQFDVVSVQARP
ncbi:MAG: hypothetical protein ABUL60_02015 [Myxococcales bacterium]